MIPQTSHHQINHARLYIVTDRHTLSPPGSLPKVLERVLGAIPPGAALVQMREKDLSGSDALQLAKHLRHLTTATNNALLINDRIDIALAVGADGVHLPQNSFDLPTARQLLGPQAILGASTHTLEEAERAVHSGANFIVFGPVWPTPSKQHYGPAHGPEKLRHLAQTLKRKDDFTMVYAIGGITPKHAELARKCGAFGAAAIRAIWRATDPSQAAQAMHTACAQPPSNEIQPVNEQ